MKDLSGKKKEIYQFIIEYMTENQYSPTVREIGAGVGLRSTSSVYGHMCKLKELGLIDYNPEQPRTIKIKGYKLIKNQ